MEPFRIESYSVQKLIEKLKELENCTKWSEIAYKDGESYDRLLRQSSDHPGLKEMDNKYGGHPWDYRKEYIGFNTGKFNRKIFRFGKKTDDNDIKLRNVKLGNYYIKFSYSLNINNYQTLPAEDLCFSDKGFDISLCPIYLPLETVYKQVVIEGRDYVQLVDQQWLTSNCILDRLEQICSKKNAVPNNSLLSESIRHTFKFRELSLGNRDNYKIKIENKIVVLPRPNLKENGELEERIPWKFGITSNPHGTLSDALNSDKDLEINAFEEILDKFYDLGYEIILGEASEEGGRKGSLVILNEELQKIRYPHRKTHRKFYEDIAYWVDNGIVKTIFPEHEKHFARIKSFVTPDGAAPYKDKNTIKADMHIKRTIDSEQLFDRNTCYLSNNSEDIGLTDRNTINVLAVFLPTAEEAMNVNLDTFNDICNRTNEKFVDINEYSRLLNRVDGHAAISEKMADTLVQFKRQLNFDITPKHFTGRFKKDIEKIKETNEPIRYPTQDDKNNGLQLKDIHVAYYMNCEKDDCKSIMFPAKYISCKDNSENEELKETSVESATHWECKVCGNVEKQPLLDELKIVRLNKNYYSAKYIILNDIKEMGEESEVSFDIDLISPIKGSRTVGSAGEMKSELLTMSEPMMGNLSGIIKNAITGEEFKLDYTSVDLIVPPVAVKAKFKTKKDIKHSSVSIARLRLMNALTGSKFAIRESYEKGGNTEINKILEKCEKLDFMYYDYCPEEKLFKEKIIKVHAGIIPMIITENSDEFMKVKTDLNDMKISFMNSLFYDWLGLNTLDKAMRVASFENLFEKDNVDFIVDLFKMFYSDSEGLPEVKKEDFNAKQEGRFIIRSWLEKEEWKRILDHHPILDSKGKFVNGAYYQYTRKDKDGNTIIEKVVFPSKKTLLKLVDIMNGNQVRLHGIVKELFSLSLSILSGYNYINTKRYKDQIFDKLTGKHGALARSLTYINYGVGAKEFGSGFLPTGVAVIGDPRFWNIVEENAEKLGCRWQDVISGKLKLYGSSQRDPFIWLTQVLNAVEIWSIETANQYFKSTYKRKDFVDGNIVYHEITFEDIYPDFRGIMLNVLDMMYLFQTDSDGDYRRILVPFTKDSQTELAILNDKMQDYNFIRTAKFKDGSSGLVFERIMKWHFNYVKDEVKTASQKYPDILSIYIGDQNTKEKNKLILKNIEGKGNIGKITVSCWKFYEFLYYLVKSEKELTLKDGSIEKLTFKDMLEIIMFYQTNFVQDGCVRALKAILNLGDFTIDIISYNGEINVKDIASNGYIKRKARDVVREEAQKAGYEDLMDKFFAACEYWKDIAAISKSPDGTIKASKTRMKPEAEMIESYVSLVNGSHPMLRYRHSMFQNLINAGSEFILARKLIEPIVNQLKKAKEIIKVKFDNKKEK